MEQQVFLDDEHHHDGECPGLDQPVPAVDTLQQ